MSGMNRVEISGYLPSKANVGRHGVGINQFNPRHFDRADVMRQSSTFGDCFVRPILYKAEGLAMTNLLPQQSMFLHASPQGTA